jgi:hypothetical protein
MKPDNERIPYKSQAGWSKPTPIDPMPIPEDWSKLPAEWKGLQNGWLLLWQHHQIFIARIEEKGSLSWHQQKPPLPDPKHFLRLRAFDQDQEYHCWRQDEKTMMGRHRPDIMEASHAEEGAAEVTWVDTAMLVRGVLVAPLYELKPDFAPMSPPTAAELSENAENPNLLALTTRNYVGYHETTHQAGYVDQRYLTFDLISNFNAPSQS